jgi:hypothetical protein
MKRLRDYQAAVLACGAETDAACRVVAVQGEGAILLPDEPELLDAGPSWTPATLSFEAAKGPVLLAGYCSAGPVPECVRFAQGDGVRMPQLRAMARLELELPVEVRPVLAHTGGRGLAVSATTIDLSGGGMLVAGYSAASPGAGAQVGIRLPGTAASLTLKAAAVRTWPDRTALRFAEPSREIDLFVLRCRQQVARLAAQRAREATQRRTGAAAPPRVA